MTTIDMDEVELKVVESKKLTARLRNRLATLVIAFFTVVFMTSTIFFAYNSYLEQPLVPSLVAKTPGRTILILNVMSQFTLFFLAELTRMAMDATRWALACSKRGTSGLTFLALSQATTFLGVLFLSFGKAKLPGRVQRNEHRIWGTQRFF